MNEWNRGLSLSMTSRASSTTVTGSAFPDSYSSRSLLMEFRVEGRPRGAPSAYQSAETEGHCHRWNAGWFSLTAAKSPFIVAVTRPPASSLPSTHTLSPSSLEGHVVRRQAPAIGVGSRNLTVYSAVDIAGRLGESKSTVSRALNLS